MRVEAFEDLTKCPFCGCEVFYTMQKPIGMVQYRMRFDGEETDNEQMYDGLHFKETGKAYCFGCNQYLGNYFAGTVGTAAQRQLIRNQRAESKKFQIPLDK